MTKRGELYIIGGLVSSTLVSGLILSSSTATAETYSKSALIRVQAACTMDGIVSTPHTDTIANGTYRSEIGETVISAVCNDGGGFGVYAIGFTSDVDGNNVMKHDTDDTFNIATGIATSGNTSNWAMKLAAVENGTDTPTIENGFSSYKAVPSNYTLVASYPNATTTGSNVAFLTHYAAYISLAQHSGVYTGKVKYVMVHPSTGPAPVKESTDDGFLDDDPDPTNPTTHTDGNNNEITWNGGTLSRAYELYYKNTLHKGMYVPTGNGEYKVATSSADYQGIAASEYRFSAQDMVPEICENTTVTFSDTKVIDERDNKSYTIRKMDDGRCWFVDNLELDLADTSVQTKMSSENTNASSEALGYLFNGGASMTSGNATNGYMSSAAFESMYTTTQDRSAYGYVTPLAGTASGSGATDQYGYRIGYSYNYCAASAGTFCYGGEGGTLDGYGDCGAPIDRPNTAIDAEYDICPTGWRLPTAGAATGGDPDAGEITRLYALLNSHPSETHFDFPTVSINRVWTSTRMSGNMFVEFMTALQYDRGNSNTPYSTGGGGRKGSYGIRCIAKNQ